MHPSPAPPPGGAATLTMNQHRTRRAVKDFRDRPPKDRLDEGVGSLCSHDDEIRSLRLRDSEDLGSRAPFDDYRSCLDELPGLDDEPLELTLDVTADFGGFGKVERELRRN